MYTLQRHLEEYSLSNVEYKILDSIWKLNQKQIPLAQNNIVFNFPHYSLHEKSHSDTIVRNIESFLGEERIKKLSPTDTWLLLMASYTHDLGMVIFHSALEKKWIEDDFQEYLEKLTEKSSDADLVEAAKLLLEVEKGFGEHENKLKLPLQIRRAVILVTAEFFRRNHHKRSLEIIENTNEELNQLLSGLNIGNLPNRFANVLANIAFVHGTEFYSTIERLEYEANGYGSDKMHPRFVACMLRLGDLLDVDDKRFNIFSEKVFYHNIPHTSQLHKEKHASTKHLLINPTSIEVTVDCQSDEVYRIARGWFDWLQNEVENQSREWTNIAPEGISGMPPTISRGKLKVLYKSVEPKKELMNLRFSISNERVFEIFEGSAIYENTEFVFIREMIQNAIDATKIQIWRLIQSGVYDFAIRKHEPLNLKADSTHQEILEAIKFPGDIPLEIFESFIINLNIFWNPLNSEELIVEVSDKGTGISENDLIRMTNKVGESHSQDEAYVKFKKTMPYWLKPTGAFGIGLQSIFLVNPYFTVHTKTESEEAREIIFYSAKKGEYSRLTDEHPKIERGSKIFVPIPKAKFREVFQTNFSGKIIDRYDYFDDKYGNPYLYKFEDYIKDELSKVELLNANILGNEILKSAFILQGKIKLWEIKKLVRKENIQCTLRAHRHYNEYQIDENISIGSQIKIVFINTFSDDVEPYSANQHRSSKNVYSVRDIPIDEKFPSYYRTNYFFIKWNFESPESDKVLNISRDKLVKKTKKDYEHKLIQEILPTAINLCTTLFEEEYATTLNNDEKVAVEYFNIELTQAGLENQLKHLSNIYNEFKLPSEYAFTEKNGSITLKGFFNYNKIYLVRRITNYPMTAEIELPISEEWTTIQAKKQYTEGCVVVGEDYLGSYLHLSDYRVAEYEAFDSSHGKIIIRTLIKNSTEFLPVFINQTSKEYLLSRTIQRLGRTSRDHLLPLEPYIKLAVKLNSYDGFYDSRSYVNHSIILPFKSYEQVDNIFKEVESKIQIGNREEVKDIIRRTHISQLVPTKLLEWVKNNSSQTIVPTEGEIIEVYIELITDFLFIPDFSKIKRDRYNS